MRSLYLTSGALLLVFVLLDVMGTVMGKGGGVLTRRMTPLLWKIGSWPIRNGGGHHYRSMLGVTVIMTTVLAWIVAFWFGWTLVFNGAPNAVIEAETNAPASFAQRLYYAGFAVSTLGVGDFRAGSDLWRMLTVVASMTGFFLVTFVISYLIPLMQAATHQRAVAVRLSAIGESPEEIILRCWDGDHLRSFESHLSQLTSELATIEQRHLAYPVLHYMHSHRRPEAIVVSVAAIDEAMTVIWHGLEDGGRINQAVLAPARQVVTQYLSTLSERHVSPADEPPGPPSLDLLRAKGLPVLSDEAFRDHLVGLRQRRRQLKGLVETDGWIWEQARRDTRPRTPDVELTATPEPDRPAAE